MFATFLFHEFQLSTTGRQSLSVEQMYGGKLWGKDVENFSKNLLTSKLKQL